MVAKWRGITMDIERLKRKLDGCNYEIEHTESEMRKCELAIKSKLDDMSETIEKYPLDISLNDVKNLVQVVLSLAGDRQRYLITREKAKAKVEFIDRYLLPTDEVMDWFRVEKGEDYKPTPQEIAEVTKGIIETIGVADKYAN